MLKIRKEQMKALSAYMLHQFEDRAYLHVMKCWPKRCNEMGEKAVRKSIHNGIDRASTYGINKEYDVIRFIDIMYVLCEDFDTNPHTAWAQDILYNRSLVAGRKIDRIWELAKQTLKNNK